MDKQIIFSFLLVFAFLPGRAKAQDNEEIFQKLKDSAIVRRKVMIPMRDGVRLSTNIYRPKGDKKVPIIFSRTPYNFNRWQNGERQTRTAQAAYEAIKRGYAYVKQNERGRYFSEGRWHYLGAPLTDASDMFKWMRNKKWSNGKIGLRGCSSTAEWQLGAASVNNAADAMVPMGYGAGIGKVGRYYHQGDWFRGGVTMLTTVSWLYGTEQDDFMPKMPKSATRADRIRVSRFYDLQPDRPPLHMAKAFHQLPIDSMFANFPKKQILEKRFHRKPNDSAWYKGGLYHENMDWNVPSFWFVSWYGTVVSPNLALFNYIREHSSSPKVRNNQYLVIAPNLHCGYSRSTKNTVIGKRSVGDARRAYNEMIFDWFDYWLKGKKDDFKKNTPHVQYYTMGSNKWQSGGKWPPQNTKMVPMYLNSDGHANNLYGDGKLTTAQPNEKNHPDEYTYDPMDPVPTHGGGFCCAGSAIKTGAGSYDQRQIETRNDVLVYSTPPLNKGVEVTGWIKPLLYVSSDAKDTDFTVKLVDVYPDGTAYNIRSTIMRARYRQGFDKEVFMKDGEVYKMKMLPIATSNYFGKGHRIRIEIASDNFPRFARNLNTGGSNYDEKKGVVAHNKIYHSSEYPSQIKLSIKTNELPIKFFKEAQ